MELDLRLYDGRSEWWIEPLADMFESKYLIIPSLGYPICLSPDLIKSKAPDASLAYLFSSV